MTGLEEPVAVVMVHGFRSKPKVWDSFADRIREDRDLDFAQVHRFSYSTLLMRVHPLRRIPTYRDVALSLDGFLNDTVGGDGPLVLVCHSQGGLVVQRYLQWMLDERRGEELGRIRQIVLFACPNLGSMIARSARDLWLRGNPQQVSLRPLDQEVSAAHRVVIDRIVKADKVTTSSCPIPVAAYAGESDKIVLSASAHGSFVDIGTLPGDHFSIVQPDTAQHRSYLALKRKLLQVRLGPGEAASRTVLPRGDEGSSGGGKESLTGWKNHTNMTPETLLNVEGLVGELKNAILSTSGASALAVTGDGGLGKTAVTYAAVEQAVAAGGFTTVVWASARSTDFSKVNPTTRAISAIYWHSVLETIAAQLGLELFERMNLEEELQAYIAGLPARHRLLVVVDNLELVHAADTVIERLRALGLDRPHKIVATTRWVATSSRSDLDVQNKAVPPLDEGTSYDLVRLVAGKAGSDLAFADNRELRPVFDITQGNPFLIKLISRRYGETGRALPRIIDELTDAARTTGSDVRHWLYDQSLDELALRTSQDEASDLMLAFCTRGRGGSLTYDVLRQENPALNDERFDLVLEQANRLGLVHPSARQERYAIHSLLYEYILPKQGD